MADPLLEQLLSDARPVVAALLAEAPASVEQLRADLDTFDELLADDASTMADVDTATRLILGCHELLARADRDSDRARRLVHAAVRYVVLVDDGDGDLESPFGFDDDVEVFNAVVDELGLSDLQIG